MSARRTTARFSLAAALIGGLALAGAAAPASAVGEADGLYSASEGDEGTSFVQLSKVDASATPFAEQVDQYFTSVEVVDGVGYAVGGSDIIESYAVFTWDITTGAVLTTVPLSLPDGVIAEGGLWALDTTTEGVLLSYLNANDSTWLVSVNPTTGAVTPLLDVEELTDENIYEGIATNPVDGVTYLLADLNEGLPGTVAVDFGAGTLGDIVEYPEVAESLGNGYFSEGDFDAAGTLWFTYSGGGVSRTDGALEVAVGATELGDPEIESKAITVGSGTAPAQPQLAATGLELAPVAGGAAILLALGGGLLIARRRAQA